MSQYINMYRPLSANQRRRLDSDVNIVVLSRYVHILQHFSGFAQANAPGYGIVLVKDGDPIKREDAIPEDWKIIEGPEKFTMAGNANIGWKATNPKADILYVGDDVTFMFPRTIEHLRSVAYSDPSIGLVSPRIIGGADNPLQKADSDSPIVYSNRYLALVCTYIKREVIEKVGYLDERFEKFWDDVDFNRRVVNAGYKLAVAPKIEVQHGIFRLQNTDTREGKLGTGTETFLRNMQWDEEKLAKATADDEARYVEKWGDNKKENF